MLRLPRRRKKHKNHGRDLKIKRKKHRRDLLVILKFISFVSRDVIVIKYYISWQSGNLASHSSALSQKESVQHFCFSFLFSNASSISSSSTVYVDVYDDRVLEKGGKGSQDRYAPLVRCVSGQIIGTNGSNTHREKEKRRRLANKSWERRRLPLVAIVPVHCIWRGLYPLIPDFLRRGSRQLDETFLPRHEASCSLPFAVAPHRRRRLDIGETPIKSLSGLLLIDRYPGDQLTTSTILAFTFLSGIYDPEFFWVEFIKNGWKWR